ncbi:MAG: hypothetical protein SVX43_03645 [Cyanobacteriota bacterium]|nr:hypothetical protein [Cyanobacteriota bacterium]
MHINAQQVKQLRDLTGARIMDCKQALLESQGELERAMQIAAFPVQYVSVEGIPREVVERQREIERSRADLADKSESLREQIVKGRVAKRLREMALLEQAYLRDPAIAVRDILARTSAAVGEKVQLKRFARFALEK